MTVRSDLQEYASTVRRLSQLERNVGNRRALIERLLVDSERQLSANSATASSLATRASILIASASITIGLQLTRPAHAGWYVLALSCSAIAALCGAVVALARRSREVDLVDLESKAWNETDTIAARRLLYSRIAILRVDRRSLFWRAIVLVVGFAFMFIGIGCACLQLIGLAAPFNWSVS
jgi:hypothetical protein